MCTSVTSVTAAILVLQQVHGPAATTRGACALSKGAGESWLSTQGKETFHFLIPKQAPAALLGLLGTESALLLAQV